MKLYGEERKCMGVERTPSVNTARKLGPHIQTDGGTCPGVGLRIYHKSRCTTGGSDKLVLNLFVVVFDPVCSRAYDSRGFMG